MKLRHWVLAAVIALGAAAGYLSWGRQDYQKKRQVSFAMQSMTAARIYAEEALSRGQPVPPLPWRAEPPVESLAVQSDGRIVLAFSAGFLPGGRLVMAPEKAPGSAIGWKCRAENVPARYLDLNLSQKCEA